MPVAVRVYRLALRAYPRWFRRRYAAAAVGSFQEGYARAAARGWHRGIGFAIAAIVDALRGGAAERFGGPGLSDQSPRRKRRCSGPRRLVDIRLAMRALRRQFWLSSAAALCIAIGIAATTAVVTLIDLTVFEPLPFPDAHRLVRVWNEEPEVQPREALSYPGYRDLAGQLDNLEWLEATARARLIFSREDGSRRVEGEAVTPGYFEMLGIRPYLGRLFTAEDHSVDAEPVMVLSHAAWGAIFQYDPSVIGATLRTNNQYSTDPRLYTVIGVLPPSFIGTIEDDIPDLEFWVPIDRYVYGNLREDRRARFVLTIGKLAEGSTLGRAGEELAALSEGLEQLGGDARQGLRYRMEPLGANWRAGFKRSNGLLSTAAGLLLAVAAANASGLLLARTSERRHELAIRASLGATRAQLVGQLLVETMLVVALGGAVGLAVAPHLLRYFIQLSSVELPAYLSIAPDLGALAVSTAVIVFTGLVSGLLPACVGTRSDIAVALHEGMARVAGSRRGNRSGRVLVVGEFATAVVLVVAAALLIRSYAELESTDLGYRTERVLRMALFVDPADVPDAAGLPSFFDRMKEAIRLVPSVETVSLIYPTAPLLDPSQARIRFPGLPEESLERGLAAGIYFVDPGFFANLEIPLLAGRAIEPGDTRDSQLVMVVGRSLAERMGGIERAVGTRVRMEDSEFLVVGVVGDTAWGGPAGDERHELEFYGSVYQAGARIVSMLVTTRAEPLQSADELRHQLAELAPSSAVDWVDDVDQFVAWTYRDSKFFTFLVAVFSVSGLILLAVGLYGVLASQVARSSMEIGVRKSFGATSGSILGLTLRRGLGLAATGLAIGLVLSVAATRILEGLLYGVQRFDTVAFASAAGVVMLIAAAASLVPARRAARVDPLEALRSR